jgi:hypothetical protein
MGLLSVTVGLTVAMLGTVVLGLACAAALVLVGRMPVRTHADRLDRDGLPSSVR